VRLPERVSTERIVDPGLDDLRDRGRTLIARLGSGDLAGMEAFRSRRRALVDRLTRLDPEPGGAANPGSEAEFRRRRAAIIRELLALDRELLTALEACQARTRHQLQQLRQARHALVSYRGPGPSSPSYLEAQG
jgi:hypothetical protein